MHHNLIPYKHLELHQCRVPQPSLASIPSASSASQRWPLGVAFQDFSKTVLWIFLISAARETSLCSRESSCLWHSSLQPAHPVCSWAFLPSLPGNFFGHLLALLSTYHLNFPFRYFCSDRSLDIDKVS